MFHHQWHLAAVLQCHPHHPKLCHDLWHPVNDFQSEMWYCFETLFDCPDAVGHPPLHDLVSQPSLCQEVHTPTALTAKLTHVNLLCCISCDMHQINQKQQWQSSLQAVYMKAAANDTHALTHSHTCSALSMVSSCKNLTSGAMRRFMLVAMCFLT